MVWQPVSSIFPCSPVPSGTWQTPGLSIFFSVTVWVADEAGRLVVLALLQVDFLGKCDDWVHAVGHSPVCQILLQVVVRAVIAYSPPARNSSAGMLSALADFPFFNDCTAAFTSLRRMGWSSSVCAWEQFSTDGSPLAFWLYSSDQYSIHRFSICRSGQCLTDWERQIL